MMSPTISIRIDLPGGARIGPGKVALLEAIRATGSISGAARELGMSYRRAWLLAEQINASLTEPAVVTATGGDRGGGAVLTAAGAQVVAVYRDIEKTAQTAVGRKKSALAKLTGGRLRALRGAAS